MAEVDAGPLGRVALSQGIGGASKAVGRLGCAQQGVEAARHLGQRDAVLRPLGAGQGGDDAGQVEADGTRVIDLACARHAEQSLCPEIGFEEHTVRFAAAAAAHVVHGLLVDREKTHRRPVLRCHVGERCAVGHRQRTGSLAEVLDKGADHFLAAQQLGHRQHQIGGSDALAQVAAEFDANHVRGQEIDRLPEHCRFRLDASDSPADDADGIDHRGVRVGADQRVGKAQPFPGAPVFHCAHGLLTNAVEQMFEIDLVDNADARRHDAEGLESLHSPFHELIAFAVAIELESHVLLQRLRRAVVIDLYRMVDDQVDRHQWFDASRIESTRLRDLSHRREIAEQWHASEILQHDARDDEGDLLAAACAWLPLGEFKDVSLADALAIAVTQQRFENDAQRHR
ncbi:MAG: hypothetical protein AW06_004377 [Candidatus Accumulibacter cognatus]|uniref:Uncharacterized protein n=1 Tax=Candidatus Accumulibacter cognatus TaxID=2954383 RepID=A0A080MC11_9PROT|nr:MAG: hypothetical protein AW06_004377 [Candidatus Accumulibacter cognatus]